jgi:hypothetical protein
MMMSLLSNRTREIPNSKSKKSVAVSYILQMQVKERREKRKEG